MALTRLQDDLIGDFAHQKSMIYEQLDVFDPLGEQLSKPAAIRLVNKGILIFAEILCYLLSVASIAFSLFIAQLYSFNLPTLLKYENEFRDLGLEDVQVVSFAIYGLFVVVILLFFFLARALRSIRLKNNILHFAATHIKTMVGQHLKRKAAIEVISQRHFLDLPPLEGEGISHFVNLNDIPNPGYEGRVV